MEKIYKLKKYSQLGIELVNKGHQLWISKF